MNEINRNFVVTDTPQVTQIYHHTLADSERWQKYNPRDGDIVIVTAYKGGTTWMQAICGALVFQSAEPPESLDAISPWVEAVFEPIDELVQRIDELTHRRYVKTHLPMTAIPYFEQLRYIFVGRDGRDVFMSWWNHWNNMIPEVLQALAERSDRKGPPMPPPPESINAAFDDWISKSSYPWEKDGYPVWSHHYHAQTWWNYRHLDNLLFVHFQDLLDDLEGQMRRISAFLDIPINESIWANLVHSVTFDEMKENSDRRAPGALRGTWKDSKNFFHKGTNRRWESVLKPSQAEHYEALIKDLMEPNLVRWMVHDEGFLDPKELR